jgi:hypothetical protein
MFNAYVLASVPKGTEMASCDVAAARRGDVKFCTDVVGFGVNDAPAPLGSPHTTKSALYPCAI